MASPALESTSVAEATPSMTPSGEISARKESSLDVKLSELASREATDLLGIRTEAEVERLNKGDETCNPPNIDQIRKYLRHLAEAAAFAIRELPDALPSKNKVRFSQGERDMEFSCKTSGGGILTISYDAFLKASCEGRQIHIHPDTQELYNCGTIGPFDKDTNVFQADSIPSLTLLDLLHRIAEARGNTKFRLREFLKAAITVLSIKGAYRKKSFLGNKWVVASGEELVAHL